MSIEVSSNEGLEEVRENTVNLQVTSREVV